MTVRRVELHTWRYKWPRRKHKVYLKGVWVKSSSRAPWDAMIEVQDRNGKTLCSWRASGQAAPAQCFLQATFTLMIRRSMWPLKIAITSTGMRLKVQPYVYWFERHIE